MSDLPNQTNQSSKATTIGASPTAQSTIKKGEYQSIPSKETEPVFTKDRVSAEQIEEVGQEVEVSPELEQWGVQSKTQRIDVAPDMQAMGVAAVGPAQSVVQASGPKLPLTDIQIESGLHAQIFSGLRWLAEWCVFQLKRAHIHLKKIHGTVMRELTA